MRPINDRKLSAHQATTLFLRLFEDYNFIQTIEFLYGLNKITGERVSRKDLIIDLRIDPTTISIVLKGLRELKLVERKVKNRNAFYKLKKEKYESLKQHYQFLTKKLTA